MLCGFFLFLGSPIPEIGLSKSLELQGHGMSSSNYMVVEQLAPPRTWYGLAEPTLAARQGIRALFGKSTFTQSLASQTAQSLPRLQSTRKSSQHHSEPQTPKTDRREFSRPASARIPQNSNLQDDGARIIAHRSSACKPKTHHAPRANSTMVFRRPVKMKNPAGRHREEEQWGSISSCVLESPFGAQLCFQVVAQKSRR